MNVPHALIVINDFPLLFFFQQVYSVYRLVLAAQAKNTPIAIINIGPTRADPLTQLKIESRVGSVFTALHSHLV